MENLIVYIYKFIFFPGGISKFLVSFAISTTAVSWRNLCLQFAELTENTRDLCLAVLGYELNIRRWSENLTYYIKLGIKDET